MLERVLPFAIERRFLVVLWLGTLATVVIGGLVSSTLRTLVALSALYRLFEREKKRVTPRTKSAMSFFVCLLVLLPLQASGASLVIPVEPHREEIAQVKRYNVAYGFCQTASGEFQICLRVSYRHRWSSLHRCKQFMFPLQDGTIVQRDPKTLMLRLENRELVVGKHRWWYDPYWQPADAVHITCNVYKQFETVVGGKLSAHSRGAVGGRERLCRTFWCVGIFECKLGVDPAASSAPFVATLVDVTGLVIYFTVVSVMLRGALL